MKSFYLAILIALTCSNLLCQTNFDGGIYTDTKWTKENSPYIITGDVVIFPTKTLTIEAGVEVKFNGNYYFEIRGRINAVGTSSDSIKFTSNLANPAMSDWKGIPIKNNQGATANFEYCSFSYAKTLITVECCQGEGSINFKNCCFEHIDHVFNEYSDFDIEVDACTFKNNNICTSHADRNITNSIFIGNEYGLFETERTNVTNSTFTNNYIALYGRGSIISGCTLENNNIAIKFWYEGFEVRDNRIANNETGIQLHFFSDYRTTIKNNQICNNEINVRNTDDRTVDLRSNCWCTSDSVEIEDKLIDGFDNISFGLFNYTIFDEDCNTVLRSVVKVPNDIQDYLVGSIKIYPNPFRSDIHIDIDDHITKPFSVEIYNLLGEIVFSSFENLTPRVINLDLLSRGLYICHIKMGDSSIQELIVKQ